MYLSRVFFVSLLAASITACGGGGGGGGGGDRTSTPPPVDGGDGGGSGGGNGGGTPGGGENPPPPVVAKFWEGGSRISAESVRSANPSVVVNNQGTVFSAWMNAAQSEIDPAVSAVVVRPGNAPGPSQVISNNDNTLDINYGWQLSLSNTERFRGGVTIAADEQGDAHVAWMEFDGAEGDIRVASYDGGSSAWSAPATIDDNRDAFEPQVFAFPSGVAYVLYKQLTVDGVKLFASRFNGVWGSPVEIEDVSEEAAISGWISGNTLNIAYVSQVDEDDDALRLATVSEAAGLVGTELVDGRGLKSNVQGIDHNDEKVVVWSERDDAGFQSLVGRARNSTWYDLPKIEELANNSQHVQLASLDGVLHIVWSQRYSPSLSNTLFDDLLTVRLENGELSEVQKLYDSGAGNPVLVKAEGKLYLQWYASHSTYSEYHPGTGWLTSTRPFCYGDNDIGQPGSGTCYNSGTDHGLSVNGAYGASVWVQNADGVNSVILSLSN